MSRCKTARSSGFFFVLILLRVTPLWLLFPFSSLLQAGWALTLALAYRRGEPPRLSSPQPSLPQPHNPSLLSPRHQNATGTAQISPLLLDPVFPINIPHPLPPPSLVPRTCASPWLPLPPAPHLAHQPGPWFLPPTPVMSVLVCFPRLQLAPCYRPLSSVPRAPSLGSLVSWSPPASAPACE